MAYFITDDNTSKGKDPNINIISGIHKIKGKTSVNILVSNYTNKHLMFHKGEYVRHLEPAVMDNNTIDPTETHQTNSVTPKKMMAETVTPDTFNPLHHELSITVQNELELLLQEYESQFAKDETSIRTTPHIGTPYIGTFLTTYILLYKLYNTKILLIWTTCPKKFFHPYLTMLCFAFYTPAHHNALICKFSEQY